MPYRTPQKPQTFHNRRQVPQLSLKDYQSWWTDGKWKGISAGHLNKSFNSQKNI